ncbi:MAG: hypothetical protein JRC68_06550 [Deltaproteobacteria bacterium]|nr:hypothetical protein [Deltaproteobacteria bacterium]
MSKESKIAYFEETGRENTDETLKLAKERADELGIKDVVVASYTGGTGVKASQIFKDSNLIVVAGVVGFREPNKVTFQDENKSIIEDAGGKVLFAGHSLGMIGRAVNRKFGTMQVDELIAHVLRLFSSGIKVGFEISCMAADAGLIKVGNEVLAIAGSGRGADSAIILKPSNTHTFFDTRFLELICKPREYYMKPWPGMKGGGKPGGPPKKP